MAARYIYSSQSQSSQEHTPPSRAPRIFKDRPDFLTDLSEEDFYDRFRFTKDSFRSLLTLLRPYIANRSRRNHALSKAERILCTLRFYATGSFLSLLGDVHFVHKSTASRVVHEVTKAIVDHLSPTVIKMPTDERTLGHNMSTFAEKSGFPGAGFAIDCTHVRIQAPTQDPEDYVNRKLYHSINVQTVVDPVGNYVNVVARWPGSTHDAFILRDSSVWDLFESGTLKGKTIVLGDGGYPCRPWLMTPVPGLNPTQAQTRYNRALSSARMAVEMSYGRLKRRWHVLHGEIRMAPGELVMFGVACALIIMQYALVYVIYDSSRYLNEPLKADVHHVKIFGLIGSSSLTLKRSNYEERRNMYFQG